MSNTTATQILFIDSRVADADVLLAGLDPAVEIVRLNSTESGLQQMANAVQGRSNISSVHVISHGGPGNLLLGSGVVNQSQLAAEQLALSTLQSALSEDADLLLYGCDVAAGAEGQSFINALAAATGADVAASTDLTGGGSAQSDWELESSTGAIETAAIDPVGYQYDLGYWGNVGLTNGDRWNVYRGSQYTVIFDADGGGKGSKYGVANNVGAYNVSNLYTSGYNGDWEAIWYTFTGSATAVPGSPWYVSNWDPDAGGYTYWGAYTNATPWQTSGTSSISIAQGTSQTLYVNDLVNDDYYSRNDTWKYFVGGSSSGSTNSYFGVGNSIPKYATFTAQTNISLKGQIYLGSMTYSVNDGVNYGNGNSLNPDYYSAYSRYKSATYTTYVYGTYANDSITWTAAPADQAWTAASRTAFNFGRGAQDPDTIDYVTGYSFVGIELKTGASSYAASTTTLPTWLKLNGTTFSVENLAPEFAGLEYRITVRAHSNDGTTIDKTFKLTTGTAAQVNDAPSSVGNSISFNEDVSYTFSETSFNFTDRDNTVGGSTSANPAHGSSFVSLKIMSLPSPTTVGVLKLNGTVITQAEVDAGLVIAKANIGQLTFEPVANYSGPASFSYKVFDGIDLSAASATMNMTVVSVNDRPIITNLSTDATPVAISSITIADTAAYNTTFTPSVGTLTGTLSATDPESTAVTLGIYGGTVSGSTVIKTGLYGDLTLTTTTGAWTYNPNKFAAINKLTGNATETFQFKATDANGYSSSQTLTINITGTNDAPVLAAALSDQTFEGAGTWSYTVPANTFIDAEGTSLTYSAVLWDGTNELALSTKGLSFNSTTLVISGDPGISETLVVRVKATDGVNTTVSDDFNLVLSNVGNLAPKVAAPLSLRVTNVPKEVTSVTFGNGVTATSVTFDGVSASAPTRTGEEVAAAVKAAYDAASGTNYTVSRAGNVLTFTGTLGVDLPTLSVSGDLTPTVANTQEGSGVKESFTLDMAFTANTAQPIKFIVESSLFGGVAREIYTIPASSTAENNATAVASALNAASWFSDGWSASSSTGIVTITSKAFGDVVDTTYDGENIVADTPRSTVWFMGTDLATKTGVPPQFITKVVDGTTATSEIKTVTFTTAYANQTLTIDGVTATVPTATGAEIASAVTSAINAGPNTHYIATANGATVTLTAKAVGNLDNFTGGSFVGAASASVTVTTEGVAGWSYQIPAGTFTDPNGDALTYTATWDTNAVPAGGVLSFDATTQTLSGNGTAFNTPITIRATDAGGLYVESAFGLQIYNNTVTASIAAGTLTGVVPFVDGKGSFTYTLPPTAFVVSGAAAPTYAATLADGTALPAWLGFNTTTGTFSGNPNGTVNDVAVKVTATNTAGSAFVTFTLDVANPNDPLVLANPVADQTLLTGAAIDFTVTTAPFTDPEGQTITYSATLSDGSALPGWLSFDAAARKFTGTPPADLPFLSVKLTGTTPDASVLSTPLTFNFTQTPVNSAGSASLAITNDTGTTGASVGDVVTVSVTDTNGVPGTGVQYQWQTSTDSGSTWQDVVGSRGTAANTLTLTQDEANAQIRVKTYYTDNQGTPEQLTSGVLNVAVNNVPGSIAILGYPAPGDNLFAQLSDANGLSGGSFVAPTYQWYRSTASDFTGETAIAGAIGASYTLTPEDGAKYIRVKVSYTDAHGFATIGLTQAANSGNPMQLAPTAPVAVNDVGSAITENSGVNNGTVGSGSGVSAGNLLTLDTDVNVNGTLEFAVEGVYLGSTEGVGTPATVTGSLSYVSNAPSDTRSYTLEGRYGSIVVAANGNYTYTLNQSNADVQALAVGQTLTESFNYEMSDGRPAYLTDTATLTITINGANDAPTLSSASALTSIVNEDIASFINTGILTFFDPDMGATASRTDGVNTNFKVYFTAATGRLLVPVLPAGATGITVTGSDTGKLTLTGSMAAINDWLSQDRIQYITAPNAEGTATVSVSANDGYGSVSLGSYTLTITPQNDAPLMDLNGLAGQTGGAAGYGLTVSFRPRGDSVLITETDAAITDADTGDTIQSAVIRLSKGAVDNEFGTIYETLSSSLGDTYTPVVGGTTFTLTGNGTTEISVTGVGTHAQYQEIVKSISYINTNPNAYGGNREVTVRLIDTADSPATRLDSNLSMLSLASSNTAVAVGQRIIINGVDSGASVAQVLDNQNFVASRQILELKATSTIKFATSAVLSTVTSGTSLVLEAGNTSVAVGQKLMVGANERATVTAVSTASGVTTVTINAGHAEITAGAQVSFETSAVSTQVATTAARKVSSDVSSATALQLNAIDLSIEIGQKIYLAGSDTGKTVTAVSHSSAGTLVTASAAMSASTAQELTFRTFATNNLPTAVTTVQNVWTTEVDLNGVLDAGRNYTATFTEGQTGGTNIASSSVSLDNQQVFVKEVVVSLTNAVDGASGVNENLLLNSAYTTVLLGRGITYALTDDDHTLTLSAIDTVRGVTAADMQLALRAVQYENLSQNPSVTPRVINVTVKDVVNSLTGDDEEGISAQTTINITPSNDAPTLAGDFAATVLEGGAYTLTTGDLSPSDIDNDITTLRYEVTSTSSSITVFRDINGDGQVDAGEAITVRNGNTAGQEFTQAEVIAGNIKVKQNGTDVPIIGLTETEAENLVNSAVYTNAAANPSAGLRQVIFQNSTQMSSLGSAATAVGQPKIALQTGSKTIDGVTYAVVMSGSGETSVATLTVSKAGTGFTEAEAQAIVASLRYGNTAATPTAENPTVSLSSVVTLTGTTEDTPTITVSTVSSVMTTAAEANAFDASDVTAANTAIPSGKNVAKLVFTVTNVAPADSEYLKLLGTQDQVDITASASDLFTGIDLSTPAAGDSYKTLSFKVTGVSDGVNETITFGSGATSHVVPLVVGSVVKEGVIYAVTAGSSATERLLTVTKPFAAIGLALRDNGENGVLPVAASMNLTVTPVNDAPTFSATVAGGTFTEGGATRTLFSAAAVTDGDTSGAEQDITELKLTITGVRDGSFEKLVVGGQTISLTSGAVVGGSLGYAVTVAGSTATVTLTKTDSASAWATLINGMAYQNTSIAPTNGNRVVTLTSVKDNGLVDADVNGIDDNGGFDTRALNLSSTVSVQGIDTAPVVTSNGATVQSGGLLTITSASPVMLTATDADSSSDTLVYTLTAAATHGTLFLDKNGNSDVDEGETLVASAEFTQTDLENGTLKYFHTGNVGADAFSFRVKDATTTLSSSTFDITVSAAGGVTGSGTSTANSTDGSDTLFQQVAITTSTGESVEALTFKVAGAVDGSSEFLKVNGRDVPLTGGYDQTADGYRYQVVLDSTGNYTVTVTDVTAPYLTGAQASSIVNGVTYGNEAVLPNAGERSISLAGVTTTDGTTSTNTPTNIGSTTTVASAVDLFSSTQASDAIPTPAVGNDIKTLTFNVSGVQDGANEVLKINGQEIPMVVTTTPIVIDGVSYSVSLATPPAPAGSLTVTVADTDGTGFTEADAVAIVSGMTLSNTASLPTDGSRSVSLTAIAEGLTTGTTALPSTPVNLSSTSSSTVSGAAVEPLKDAALSVTAGSTVDALTFKVSGVLDGAKESLVIGGTSVPLINGLTLSNDAGTYTVSVSGTPAEATVIFTPVDNLTADEAKTLVNGVDYLNTANPVTEGLRSVSLESLNEQVGAATPTTLAQTSVGSVTLTASSAQETLAQPLTLFAADQVEAAIPTLSGGDEYKSVSFELTGILDGASEVFRINGQDIPLVEGDLIIAGVTYSVVDNGDGAFTVTMSDATSTGWTDTVMKDLVANSTLTNTDGTPTAGSRSVSLAGLTEGATSATSGTTTASVGSLDTTTAAPGVPLSPFTGETVPTLSGDESLTFTVTGVKDGASEILTIGGVSIPLVPGSVASTSPAGTYTVILNAEGTATVVFAPSDASTFNQSDAQSLVSGATYTNTSTTATAGNREVSLTQIGSTPVSGVGEPIAVAGVPSTDVFSDNDTVSLTAGTTVNSLTFGVSGVRDGAEEKLIVNGQTLPLVDGHTTTNTSGTYVVSVVNGNATVTFTPSLALTEAEVNALLNGISYVNKDSSPTDGARGFSVISMETESPALSSSMAVGSEPDTALLLFAVDQVATAIPALTGTNEYKSVSFNLTGILNGADEVFRINGQNIPLQPGTLSLDGVTYTVTSTGANAFTVTMSDTASTGWTESVMQNLVANATLTNTDGTPTAGSRSVALSGLTEGATSATTGTPTGSVGSLATSTAAPNVPLSPFTGETVPTASGSNSLTFTVKGVKDGSSEILTIGGTSVPLVPGSVDATSAPLGTYTVTLDAAGTATVVFVPSTPWSGNAAETLVLGATYTNTASTATAGNREVSLTHIGSTPVTGVGEPIAVAGVPSTDVFSDGDTVTVSSGTTVNSLTFGVSGIRDGADETLVVNGHTLPMTNGYTTTDTSGTYKVDVDGDGNATVTFTPAVNLTVAEANAVINGITYANKNTSPTAGARSFSVLSVESAVPDLDSSVSLASVPDTSLVLFAEDQVETAIPVLTGGNEYKSVSFELTGISDGSAEVFRINGRDIPLQAGSVTVDGVTYSVVDNGGGEFTVTMSDTASTGWTESVMQNLVANATLTNTDGTPTAGSRSVSLAGLTEGAASATTGTTTGSVGSLDTTTAAPGVPLSPFTGETVPTLSGDESLTFTVTGVKDGSSEVLKFGVSPNITSVPLVPGTVASVSPAGTYTVTLDAAGTATVVFAPTDASTFSQSDAQSLVLGATYTNTSTTATAGNREVSLTQIGSTPVTGVGEPIAVAGVPSTDVFSNSDTVTLTAGTTVNSLTFGVSGILNGADEQLVVNGHTLPMTDGYTTTDASGTYKVAVDGGGNATVIFTPTANLSEAEANAVINGISYANMDGSPTGTRSFSVMGMETQSPVQSNTATTGLNSTVSTGTVSNTAPYTTVNTGATVAENQTVTLTANILSAADAEQNNLGLVYTLSDAPAHGKLFRDLNDNGLINAGEVIEGNANTFTQGELVSGKIKYRHDGSETLSDLLQFSVSDGELSTPTQPFVITVTSVNDTPAGRPTIDGVIAQNAVLTASLDSMSDGDGLPTSAGRFQYVWKADGQTVGANASTFTLTADEIDKKITVSVSYTDLAGFSHTVTSLATAPVVNVNDAPTLTASTLSVFEGGTITLNTSQIVAADQDGLTLDHQFKLMTALTKGQIYLDANGNGLLDSDDETVVAANGTFTQDDLFSGRVRYQHLGSEEGESFGLQVIDGGGLASATATFTVTRTAVNDAPTFQNLDGDVIAVPTAGVPVLLDRVATGLPAAVVADVDSTDLAGGQLRVAVNFNRNPAKDSLAIKQVGTGTGQISTSGSDVKFGTITIGTFAGGSGANDLLVTFNASATKAAISALVSAITFQNDESIPAESVRTVAFTLTDGDGGTSDVARVTVNLEANGAPIFLNTNTSVAVFENNTQVGVFAATDPLRLVTTYSISSRDDSANADRAKFAINATTGVLTFVSAPDFETPTDAGTDNHYNVVVRATNANGYSEMPVEVAIIDQVTGTGEVAVDRTPPTYVMGTLSGNTLVLYFSEATSLNAVNKPDRSAFTVTAGNTAVAIAALAVNATAKTVTLTLATALSSVTGLTVAYADPTAGNDSAALQDIAGNDAASFSVSNITLMTGSGGGSGGSSGGAPHVAPSLESQVSTLAGASNVAGDGNGDGIADVNQSAVASLPFMMTRMPETVPDNSAMRWVTVVAGAVSGKVGANESTRITQIEQKDAPQSMSGQIEMPMGAIDFELSIATPGAATTMSTYVDADMSFNGYWVKNSNGIWTNLASAAFGGAMVEEAGKIRIDINIQDGGEFDSDGLANGVVSETAFVGTIPLTLIGTYSELPDGQTWFGNIS